MNLDPISTWNLKEHCKRSIEEAIAELEREMQVRTRIYDRWINEGKLSRVDAWDRMERQVSAVYHLTTYHSLLANQTEPMTEGDHPPAIEADFRAVQKGLLNSSDIAQA